MVYSPTKKGYIAQGQPHKTKAAAEKDAKMFESVQIDEDIKTIHWETCKCWTRWRASAFKLNNLPRNKGI